MECFIVRREDVSRFDDAAVSLTLREEEAHHATRSLRLRIGDELLATDLEGCCYACTISAINADGSVECTIQQTLPEFGESTRDIALIQGLIAQPARWEFLLEKATELGVRSITPVTTERTERSHFKADRSERILRAAVKQTKRARIPTLQLGADGAMLSLEHAMLAAATNGRTVFIFHEAEAAGPSLREAVVTSGTAPLTLVVGPEGGFSDAEIESARVAGAHVLSLGPRRLRAETAAIAAIAILGSDATNHA